MYLPLAIETVYSKVIFPTFSQNSDTKEIANK